MILRNTMTLVLKVTHSCNLNCDYCFYLKEEYSSNNHLTLKIDELKFILLETSKICHNLNLVFHGGEPFLVPLNYYNEILDYQNELTGKFNVKFNNSIQSNGTIMNIGIISLLKKGNFSYGVSLDGYKEIHDSHRPFRNNKNSSYDVIIDNIGKLHSNDYYVSSLIVATKDTLSDPLRFYQFFKKARINIKINEMFFSKKDEYLAPNNNELSEFMIKLFDLWFMDNSNDQINIEPFTTIISSFWGENAGDCCYKSTCASFFIIENDGSVSLCSRLNFLDHNFGTLHTNKWEDILNSDLIKNLNKRIFTPYYQCLNCKWLKACYGGCTASAFEINGHIFDKTYWCESRKQLFEHIYNKLELLN
jgi:uncharacterized protein